MYVIPSIQAKRVKHIDQQGHVELEARDTAAFRTAAIAAAAVAQV